MARALLIATALGSLTGCIRSGAFACANDQQCGPNGRCEDVGFCSFPDPLCGRRFGEAAGAFSNQCVGGGGGDGGVADSNTDGSSLVDGPPADVPATACSSMTVLFGSNDTTGGVTDTIPANIVDAFGFDAATTVTVNCAWIFVENQPAGSGNIEVGVYDTVSGDPRNLLATAVVNPTANNQFASAPLSTPLTLSAGSTFWIAAITTSGSFTTPIHSSCGAGQHPLHNDTGVSALPNPLNVAQTFTTCAAAFFLGP